MKNLYQKKVRMAYLLVLVIVSGCALLILPQNLPAQVIRTVATPTPQKQLIVFKGKIVKKVPELERVKLPPPANVTRTDPNKLFDQLILQQGITDLHIVALPYATLDARRTYVENRAAIKFAGTEEISSLSNSIAFWNGASPTWFVVYVKPQKQGQWFLVDCVIETPENTNFLIEGPDGSDSNKTVKGHEHIQVFLLAQNAEWHQVIFQANAGPTWYLNSCEINMR